MLTPEELLDKMNTAIDTLQDAQETVLEAVGQVTVVRDVAERADSTANTAQVAAEAADAKAVAAQGIAAEATQAAGVAQTSADNANTGSAALQAQVDNAETGLAATKAIADGAKAVADAALPKTGGTIDGTLWITPNAVVEDSYWDVLTIARSNASTEAYQSHGFNQQIIFRLANTKQVAANAPAGSKLIMIQTGAPNTNVAGGYLWNDLAFVITEAGDRYLLCATPPANATNTEIVTAAWARSHFIEQLTADRMYIGGGSTADKKVPEGGTWAYYTINLSTKGVTKGYALVAV